MKLRSFSLLLLGLTLPVLLGVSLNFIPDAERSVTVKNKNTSRFAILPRFKSPGTFRNGLAPVRDGGLWGFIDRSGDWIIEPSFRAARPFHDGKAAAKTSDGWGYINRSGDWIIPPQYEHARSFSEGRAAVKKNGRWTFVTAGDRRITSFDYSWVGTFRNGRAVVATDTKKGFIGRDGATVIEPVYRDAAAFSEGVAPVKTRRGWGYINRSGTFVISPRYTWADPVRDGRARVRQNGDWALLDFSRHETKTIPFPVVSRPGNDGFIRVKEDGRVGFLDADFDTAIEPSFDQALSFRGKLTPAKKGGLWGYINRSGEWVITPKYNAAGPFHENRAPVKVGDQWGYIPRPGTGAASASVTRSSFRVDTGLRDVEKEDLNESLQEQFPTWRYDKRDRYVRVLNTSISSWSREVTVPTSNFEKPNAKYEVTRFPYREPTYLQIEAAEQFFWRTLKTAMLKNWFVTKKGLRDGFGLDGKGGVDNHFFKEEHFLDERLLVPNIPETLIYHGSDPESSRLGGIMFYHRDRRTGGPQIGGSLTVWHYHVFDDPVCHEGVLVQPFDKTCASGTRLRQSPEMIHIWFINHPDGSFGTQTKLASTILREFDLTYDPG